MKYLKTYPEKCVGCRACEEACSLLFFKESNPEKSCIKIAEKDNGYSISVCCQCGNCMKLCPTSAITRNAQGIITINKKECVGCLICVAECCCQAMRYHPDVLTAFNCLACGACVSKCPAQALEIVKGESSCQNC